MGEQRKSESWIAWITLLLAILAWSFVIIVSATKGIKETLWIRVDWVGAERAIQVPMLLASIVYASLGAVSYFLLKWRGFHSRKNTAGLVLSGCWFLGLLILRVASPYTFEVHRRDVPFNCWWNVFEVGCSCTDYALDHGDSFPPSLESLCDAHLDPKQLVCRETWSRLGGIRWPPPQNAVDAYLTYRYVTGLRADDPREYILFFDEEGNHPDGTVNVFRIGDDGNPATIEAVREQLRRQAAALKEQGRETQVVKVSLDRLPREPVHVWPPWWMGWRGAFACVAVGFLIPVAGMILWEQWRRWRLARRE